MVEPRVGDDVVDRVHAAGLGVMRAEHQALIDALARGDADEAERVTREELESSKAMVIGGFMSCESLLDVSISGLQTRTMSAAST